MDTNTKMCGVGLQHRGSTQTNKTEQGRTFFFKEMAEAFLGKKLSHDSFHLIFGMEWFDAIKSVCLLH